MDNRIENVFKIRFNDRTRFVSNRFVEFVSTNATTLKRNLIFIKKKKKIIRILSETVFSAKTVARVNKAIPRFPSPAPRCTFDRRIGEEDEIK